MNILDEEQVMGAAEIKWRCGKAEGAREEELRRWEMKSDMQDGFIGPALSLFGEYSVFLSQIQRLHWESIIVRRQLVTAHETLGRLFFFGKKKHHSWCTIWTGRKEEYIQTQVGKLEYTMMISLENEVVQIREVVEELE